MFRILIVEDDPTIRSILGDTLRKWNYETIAPETFDKIDEAFAEADPHLVLLDINLPVYDGYYWCRYIRSRSKVPILFLSSRQENFDMITAINMGGDDYVQKPFDLELLIVKVQALLRRSYDYQEERELTLSRRGVTLYLDRSVVGCGDASLELTRNEFVIFKHLMQNAGKIVSRDALMQALWNDDQFIDDNTLTVNVNRLRKRLAACGIEDLIETRKNMGYLIP